MFQTNKKLIKKNIFVFILISFVFLFNSCNDTPTEIGTKFLQDTISINSILNTDSVLVDVKSYFYNSEQERNTGSLFIGNTDNFMAGGLIRFNVPIDRTDIKEEDITYCKIHFSFNNYKVGNNTLSFKIKEVTSSWDVKTNVDDVLNNEILFSNDLINEWTGDIKPEDSTFNIELDFSPKMVVEWFNKINDGSNITDTIWGIGIISNEESNVIASFRALSNAARENGTYINIKYKTYTDTGEVIDSLKMYSAEEVSFVKDKRNIESNSITLQGGARIHTKFSFNMADVPKLAAINNAELKIFLNENVDNDSIPGALFLNYFGDYTERISNSLATIQGNYDTTNKCYIFKEGLPNALNYIIRDKNGIADLILTYSNAEKENNKLDKLNFLYETNDKNKYIKLKIFYSRI